jgi:P-type Cu2+ transporter
VAGRSSARAVQGLRQGVAHLDLPIAAGIALVYLSSLAQMRGGRGDLAYFDTLGIFITLMLAGRLLQERLLERNRRFLLEDDGVQGLLVRRVEEAQIAVRPAAAVRAGDRLLVAPGELVPVDATLDDDADVSTDWINGESTPRALAAGETVQAGSFNAGSAAFAARAATDFDASPLVALLATAATRGTGGPHGRLWQRLARWWVAGVVVVALAGFALWLPHGGERALAVAAAILVVTCPCAIGIAVPLAYELTLHGLRRRGAYVRGFDLLDRLPRIRRIVFDKTGTLTLGELELVDPSALVGLPAPARDVAYNLAVRSAHPASRAVTAALAASGARFLDDAAVRERPGHGVEWRRDDGLWRLGASAWATGEAGDTPVLARDGRLVTRLELGERLRPDAARELGELTRRGYELWLLSGDEPGRVAALAERLGVPAQRALGALSPEAKWLSFGRLRPLHTNAVIFAFVGNMMFAGIYYSTQRLLKARMASTCCRRSTSGAGRRSSSPRRSRCRSAHTRARSTPS